MNEKAMNETAEVFFKGYLDDLVQIFGFLAPSEFGSFIAALQAARARDAHVFVCGNGGSAATSSHFVCDMNKGTRTSSQRCFKVISLNDSIPTLLAYANDMSYADVFAEQLRNFARKDDLVIGISCSGNSENVLRAIRYANEIGCITLGLCGFDGGRLKPLVHQAVHVISQDMQKIEDVHGVLLHCVMQWFLRG